MATTLRFGPAVGLTAPQVSRSSSTHQMNSCSTSSSVSAAPLLRGSSCNMSRRSVLAGRPLAEDCNWTTRAAAEVSEATPSSSSRPVPQNVFKGLSYSQQYDTLYSAGPLNTKQVLPKPDPLKQQLEPGAKKVFLSDVHGVTKRDPIKREWNVTDYTYAGFLGGMHLLALAAPFTFSWPMVFLFLGTYFVSGCLGITLSYHRQLAHKSFQTPKWLEYTLAYCGVLAVQGDPMEWASSHRYHHLHTDTPLDPHSPYEGFWWSHFGWLLDNTVRVRT
ncbi:hypothetical protein DUNSADRAFT_16730 [Dunaliella salina]|uniref:Fatty acid desaturase domain-containing protein n=1 Tax=Dunaliella salina TaxID=3046 RepID=A0ABQ7G300_DUNSA|nr:hypothetical protein DUNSADRAFT_16730 [Dunaliella salina]|eukprot:KAF5828985.1 hypothetical protein DUNSADRAFT_16730 [Dunaliella salina]